MSLQQVFVGMSGGVDSSVAAVLLQQAGYQVSGINLQMFHGEEPEEKRERACGAAAAGGDAAAVAQRLGIPFQTLDFSEIFRERVICYFVKEYQCGRTPNPCAECNRSIKFGELLERVRALGGDYLATGHYARVERDGETGRYLLKRGLDRAKDQSYFLYALTQDQLAHTLFPLGELRKEEVRRIAEEQGLVNAQKRDSQDICFVPDGDYAAFIERTTGCPSLPGVFLDQEGRELGRHKGIIRYTRGQHKGLGISSEQPLYVLEKNAESNIIRLGPDSALWSRTLTAGKMNWIAVPKLDTPMDVTIKTRHSQREAAGTVEPLADGRVRVTFREPQRAITAGQAVVFYDDEVVVGGGTIMGE